MTKPQDPIEPPGATRPAAAHPALCGNCGTALQGGYCHVCGQHGHDPLKSLRHAIEDVFESFWHVDGRIFRTLRELLVPGRVATNYLAGQRARYIPPLRLFVILSLLTFFVAHFAIDRTSIVLSDMDNSGIAAANTVDAANAARDVQLALLEAKRATVPEGPGKSGMLAGLEARRTGIHAVTQARIDALLKAQAAGLPPPAPMRDSDSLIVGDKPWDPRTNPVRVAWLPGFANNWLNSGIGRGIDNAKRYGRDQDALKDAWISAVPTALFFLVPVFALLLRLFYLSAPWSYLQHLVVALYSHALLLLGSLLAMLASLAARAAGWAGAAQHISSWMMLAMAGYLLLMHKRVYQQGWPMTALKFVALGSIYGILLGFGALAALLIVFLE